MKAKLRASISRWRRLLTRSALKSGIRCFVFRFCASNAHGGVCGYASHFVAVDALQISKTHREIYTVLTTKKVFSCFLHVYAPLHHQSKRACVRIITPV